MEIGKHILSKNHKFTRENAKMFTSFTRENAKLLGKKLHKVKLHPHTKS